MSDARKDRIIALLKSIETGDPGPVAVVDQTRYVQHNPQTHEGSAGLETLFKRLSQTHPKVNAVRAFEDGDFVFAHMEYDFSSEKVCFEVFRFEGERAVEHWDNIQPRLGPNRSGHSMVDGPVTAGDLHLTGANRAIISQFVTVALIPANLGILHATIDRARFVEHNPGMGDDLSELSTALQSGAIVYEKLHRVLAQGDFVLSVSEGRRDGAHTAFYDLFRLSDGKIVEHWDTTETVAPPETWKNDNGKF